MLLTSNEYGQVQQVELSQDISALKIQHNCATAMVSLYGGHVLSWQPSGEKEIFWLSQTSEYQQGKAIRGGIPLCWPWFGAHPDDIDNKMGNHGFARTQCWKIEFIDISKQGVEICLNWHGENMNPLWPFAGELKQNLFFGESFKQVFTMKNNSAIDAYYTGALHSYFAVSSPNNVKVDALAQATFYDKLTGKNCEPQPLVNAVGPVDRIYHTDKVMTLVDENWQREITLKTINTQQWVFWNPGEEVAKKMADIHLNGEQEFVCLEAANTQMQLLPAGQSASMEQIISVCRR